MNILLVSLGIVIACGIFASIGIVGLFFKVKSLGGKVNDNQENIETNLRDIYSQSSEVEKETHQMIDEIYRTIDSKYDKLLNKIKNIK
jgi:hypothetical protein